MTAPQNSELQELPREFDHPAEAIYWAAKKYRKQLVVTSSFQTQSVPLLHMISHICPNIPIIFLDTGFHFPETLAFRDELKKELGLNIKNLTCLMGQELFSLNHNGLYKSNPNMCCYLNKVEPLERELKNYSAWISGIRRDQTEQRKNTPTVAKQKNGLFKVCPLVDWTEQMVIQYIERKRLPKPPLFDLGYRSVGCHHCTKPTTADQDSRSGRWLENEKTECGLHFNEESQQDVQP